MITNAINFIKGRYRTHPQAIIVSCFYNPTGSEYRLKAFKRFYETIRHMPHVIAEVLIGEGAQPQLPDNANIVRMRTPSLLWHKEAALNQLIRNLPQKYRFVFWIDADVIFSNPHWLTESVRRLQNGAAILQPFEYCTHMEKDETSVDPVLLQTRHRLLDSPEFLAQPPLPGAMRTWRSFCSNYPTTARRENYDHHGHVGFAWGARRELLDQVPLYDKALIGGADHIIAHAAAGHTNSPCIRNAFADDIQAVNAWVERFYSACLSYSSDSMHRVAFVSGDLFHIWHGDLNKRQYAQRIREFAGMAHGINTTDNNGFYVTHDARVSHYVGKYFKHREVPNIHVVGDSVAGAGTNNSKIRSRVSAPTPAPPPVPARRWSDSTPPRDTVERIVEDAVAFGAGALLGHMMEGRHANPHTPGHGGQFSGAGATGADADPDPVPAQHSTGDSVDDPCASASEGNFS